MQQVIMQPDAIQKLLLTIRKIKINIEMLGSNNVLLATKFQSLKKQYLYMYIY